jgi:hypothetical protein
VIFFLVHREIETGESQKAFFSWELSWASEERQTEGGEYRSWHAVVARVFGGGCHNGNEAGKKLCRLVLPKPW